MTPFNVIIYNVNANKFEPYNIMPPLIEAYNERENKPTTFDSFANFILGFSAARWWARCEYEIILSDWPNQRKEEKWDIYSQIRMNIDVITTLLMKEVL